MAIWNPHLSVTCQIMAGKMTMVTYLNRNQKNRALWIWSNSPCSIKPFKMILSSLIIKYPIHAYWRIPLYQPFISIHHYINNLPINWKYPYKPNITATWEAWLSWTTRYFWWVFWPVYAFNIKKKLVLDVWVIKQWDHKMWMITNYWTVGQCTFSWWHRLF